MCYRENVITFKNFQFESVSDRLCIRTLDPNENLDDYLSFVRNKDNIFIESVNSNWTLDSLKSYVISKNTNPTAILLGLFDLESGVHIGNMKFEPMNLTENYSVLGIFIGRIDFRGLGLAQEAIGHIFSNLLIPIGVNKLVLGVDKKNNSAISAYKKCGFRIAKNPILNLPDISHEMILEAKF
jgi:ribosomal-protein-alanine N-acetyltransferase